MYMTKRIHVVFLETLGDCLSPKDFPLLRDCSFTDQSSADWVMGEQ